MARILGIIPKGIRIGKKIKVLNSLKKNQNEIQQRLGYAKKTKLQLDRDLEIENRKLCRSTESALGFSIVV